MRIQGIILRKKSAQYVKQANKGRKTIVFQPREYMWLYLCKDRFPNKRKSKLSPRGDGPFKVLEKINYNAYKIELPLDYTDVNSTFKIKDLLPFVDEFESRMTPFLEGEVDEEIPTNESGNGSTDPNQASKTPMQGPITRSHAKKILPKYCTHVLLRFTHMEIAAGLKRTSYTKEKMSYAEIEPSNYC
jgi:hypothetical protein